MYIEHKKLLEYIENGDEKIKNYFDTFGFVVVKNILNKKEFKKYLKEYDSQYNQRTDNPSILTMLVNRFGFTGPVKYGFRKILKRLFGDSGMTFLPCFLEESKLFTELFLSPKMKNLFKYFCGENWLYLGSDGSRFITTSFPWHRDWFTKMPIMKCNFYFNPYPYLGGRFFLIPGSNQYSDNYSRLIQKSMSWPMQNKNPSGLSENNRLPPIKNPRDYFSIKNLFKKSEFNMDVPHVSIKLGKGDLLLFDHRALHCVETTFPKFQRRLLTFLVSKNAYDFDKKHYALEKNSKKDLMTDLVDLIVNERNHIGCKPWGDELLKTDFVNSNHYIDIKKSKKDGKYDIGSFKISGNTKPFVSKLDFNKYENIGSTYKSFFESKNKDMYEKNDKGSQKFSYQNVHLGINSQNIKDIES